MQTLTTGNGKQGGIRVLVVDDHPIVRQGLRLLLERQANVSVCDEAESPTEAMRAAERCRPDLAVVDLTLKEGSGLELIHQLRARHHQLPVLVLTVHDEAFYAERVLRAGARGYICKSEGSQRLLEAIRCVLGGQVYLSRKLADRVIGRFLDGSENGHVPAERLTDRELEVFELIGQGLATREVAERLHLSPKTIDSHREHIKSKLGLNTGVELLREAIQWVQFGTSRPAGG